MAENVSVAFERRELPSAPPHQSLWLSNVTCLKSGAPNTELEGKTTEDLKLKKIIFSFIDYGSIFSISPSTPPHLSSSCCCLSSCLVWPCSRSEKKPLGWKRTANPSHFFLSQVSEPTQPFPPGKPLWGRAFLEQICTICKIPALQKGIKKRGRCRNCVTFSSVAVTVIVNKIYQWWKKQTNLKTQWTCPWKMHSSFLLYTFPHRPHKCKCSHK